MSLFRNSENYIMVTPIAGFHFLKPYVFKETVKRYSLLRSYVSKRSEEFKDFPYFCITGVTIEGKWDYGNYSLSASSKNLPLPEVIYDIANDKIYQCEGHLWELPEKTLDNGNI